MTSTQLIKICAKSDDVSIYDIITIACATSDDISINDVTIIYYETIFQEEFVVVPTDKIKSGAYLKTFSLI